MEVLSKCFVFKSRLQEYAQKAGLTTPVYEVVKEVPCHEPSFSATVVVDNKRYCSLPGFTNRKAAEQSAAEIALVELSISGHMKETMSAPVHEIGLCKNMLQEYALKMNSAIPVYTCESTEIPGKVKHFTCTVDIGGTKYAGGLARTKKEAEIKAASTALLAIKHEPGDDTDGLCKNMLQEYAVKMNSAIPVYTCERTEIPGKVGHFTCTVDIGGTKYVGGLARTKKEAEIKAARTALLAIKHVPGDDTETPRLTMIPIKRKVVEKLPKAKKKVDEPEEVERKESEGTHSCSNQWNSPRPKANNETEVIQWGQRTGGKRNRQENMSGPSNRLPKPVDRFTLEEQEILSVVEPWSSWGSDKDEVLLEQPSSRGQQIEANISSSWGKKVAVTEPKSSSCGKKAVGIQMPEQHCGTTNEVATKVESDGWGGKATETKSNWGQAIESVGKKESDRNVGEQPWVKKVHETKEAAPDKSSWQTWGKKTTELQSQGQDATSGDVSSNTGRWSSWGKKVDEPEEAQRKESEGTHSFSNQWNSPRPKADNETEVIQWGQRTGGKRNRQENISGPSNRLPKPVDRFTLEEQEILSVVEPIAHTIKRILHHSRYNEGDRLSADDEAYLLNQVFNYHPNKAEKMGAGVDHVVVNKHSTHQNSKCFYIIQTDGHQEDFSTRKCIMNIITEKFPEKADGFIKKYYLRQANRERDAAGEMVASNAAETPHVGHTRSRQY